MRNYVLDHDNQPQPVAEARKAMEAKGFYLHELPKELDSLYVGSDGFYYTKYEDQMLKIGQRPQPGTTIGEFNKAYTPTTKGSSWVFKYKTDEGEWINAYTELTKRAFKADKSDDIIPMLESVPAARPKWLADMQSDNDRVSVPALLTEICYLACSRIGGDGFTKEYGKTYGLSTLEVSHCFFEKGQVVLEYAGKDAKTQTHIFRDGNKDEHRIASSIRSLAKGKQPDDMLFTYENGKPCTAPHVRDYMKTLGVPHLTPHKMRSIRGSALMVKLLGKYSDAQIKKLAPGAADKLFKEEAVEVGKLLGHVAGGVTTATTALKNYIDPMLAQSWFSDHGLRVPLWMKSCLVNLD